MTREEFQSSEELMSQLDAVLKFPIVQTAFEVVRKMGLKSAPQPIPGVDYGAQMAAHGAQLLAWNECLEAFHHITYKPRILSDPNLTHTPLYTHAAKTRMAATNLYTAEELESITPE